jgi:hypothetical protein
VKTALPPPRCFGGDATVGKLSDSTVALSARLAVNAKKPSEGTVISLRTVNVSALFGSNNLAFLGL